jgi:glycosyltransferase involved in cell wall biosynthesis
MTSVSLVMPVWSPHPEWFRRAVESALEDDAVSELIVVDDGSEEEIEALLPSPLDPRTRVLHTTHGGPSHARNVALAEAGGAYVRFVDADDVVVPGSTSRLLSVAEEHGGIAHAATVVCDTDLRPQRTVASELEGSAVRACLLGTFDVRVVSLLFPRAAVDAAGPWDEDFAVSGDWDFVLRCVEHADVHREPGVATYYRRWSSSVSRSASIASGEAARRRVVEKYFERHPGDVGSPLERAARAATLASSARGYAATGELARAVRHWAGASRLEPRQAAPALYDLARLAAARRLRSSP